MHDRDRESLEREIAALKAELERLRERGSAPAQADMFQAVRKVGAPRPPLRSWTLDTLRDVGHPLYSAYLTPLYFCTFNRTLAPARLGTLSADERKRFRVGHADEVILTNGLMADRGTPIKRIWGRSDWPLAHRVIADTSGRVLFLKTAMWVFNQAMGDGNEWENFAALKLMASQLARDLPVDIRTKPDDFEGWSARARTELAGLEGTDRERREAAAVRLGAVLKPVEVMFGAPGPLTVVPGTEEQAWKDRSR
jgi:hypothetical protein